MEEQIRKIMDDTLMGGCEDSQICADMIASHFREFMMWMHFAEPCQFYPNPESGSFDDFYSVTEKKQMPLDDCYQWWFDNVKNK